MDAKEIKARLDAVDVQLAAKLRELGFTEDEITRQLDTSVPTETRKAEAEKILARKFVADLNDPKSGLMDRVIDRAIEQAEVEFPGLQREMEAERAARRKKIGIGVGAAVVIAGVIVYFAVLRTPSVTMCEQLAKPVDELAAIVGKPLTAGRVVDMDVYCTLVLGDANKQSVITFLSRSNRGFLDVRATRDGQPFSKRDSIKVPTGDALIYIAGEPAPDASGRNDILFEVRSLMVEVDIERAVTPDQVRALAIAIATRAKAAK